MSKLQPYGVTEMIEVTPEMSASEITCVVYNSDTFDDFTERPEERPSKSDLTELS